MQKQDPPVADQPQTSTSGQRHLWQIQWVRDLALLIALVVVAWLTYSIRAMVTPIVLGLVAAYVFDPLVRYIHTKRGWPRWLVTLMIMLVGATLCLALILAVAPKVVEQAVALAQRMPTYVNQVSDWLNIDWQVINEKAQQQLGTTGSGEASDAATTLAQLDWQRISQIALNSLGYGLGVVGSVFSVLTYMLVASVTMAVCFFVFSWRFDAIVSWFSQFTPPAHREQTLRIVKRMDHTIAAFIRGRLIQAAVMALILCVGWYFAGVPFWLLLGLLTGALNLIPFAAVVGAVVAVVLVLVDHISGHTFTISAVAWPLVVYGAAQLIDGWVVEPAVQGAATDLDPLTVMLAVLLMGSLAGVLGMVVAIPLTACLKILSQEIFIPKLRALVKTV